MSTPFLRKYFWRPRLTPSSVQLFLQLTRKQSLPVSAEPTSFGVLLIITYPRYHLFECFTVLPRPELSQRDPSHFDELLDELKTYRLLEIPGQFYMHPEDLSETPNAMPFSDVSFSGILYSRLWMTGRSARLYFKIEEPAKKSQPVARSTLANLWVLIDILFWRYIALQVHAALISSAYYFFVIYVIPCEERVGLIASSWIIPVVSLLFVARDAYSQDGFYMTVWIQTYVWITPASCVSFVYSTFLAILISTGQIGAKCTKEVAPH
ncbi:hypothetical protein PG984_004651 [Apiospora sp. TS-2023a]